MSAPPPVTPGPTRLAAGSTCSRLGLLGLRTRRMRAVLSALGISIGIATMVVVTGIPASSQQDLMSELSALGTNMLQRRSRHRTRTRRRCCRRSRPADGRAGSARSRVASAVANTHAVVRRNDRPTRTTAPGLTVLAARPTCCDGGQRPDALRPVPRRGHRDGSRPPSSARSPPPGSASPGWHRPAAARRSSSATRWFTVIGILDPLPLAPEIDRSVLVGWEAAAGQLGFDGHPTVVYLQASEDAIEDVRAVLPATLNPRAARPGPGQPPVRRAGRETGHREHVLRAVPRPGRRWRCWSAASAWPTRWSSRCWNAARRSACAGRWAPTGARSAAQFLTESVLLSVLGGLAGHGPRRCSRPSATPRYQGWPP